MIDDNLFNEDELLDEQLADQIPDGTLVEQRPHAQAPVADEPEPEPEPQAPVKEEPKQESMIGKKLTYMPGQRPHAEHVEEDKDAPKLGGNVYQYAEIQEGWIDVNRKLLGERSKFYPEDWRFRIRPATVEAIRNWSTIDEESFLSMDEVFTEVLKNCLSITTSTGLIPCTNICSWDRFFFLLLIREYTFMRGESEIKYEEDCIECGNPITFKLTSEALMYELPDPDLMPMYDPETRSWHIDPREYDVNEDPITLYLPNLEKETNIKNWLIQRQQENRNRKIDQVFLKFAAWLSPKISKDNTIANRQIRELERIYKSWDIDMFSFMDEVVKNITVNPETKLTMKCPVCGEEVTSPIRFPGKVSDLFAVQSKRKKFGSK